MKFRLSSILSPDKYSHFNRLQNLRLKTVIIFGVLFIIIMFFVISYRIFNGQLKVALINFSAVSLVSLSIFCAFKGFLNTAIVLLISTISMLVFLFSFTNLLEPMHLIPQFSLLICASIILLDSLAIRRIYIIVSLILLQIICLNFGYTFIASITFLIQILGFTLAFNHFVNYLEAQDQSLDKVISNLENSERTQKTLANSLRSKNQELKTFTNIMTHDLKSPIRTINTFSGLIRKKLDFEDSSIEDYFKYIQKSATQMEVLISDLLLYANIEQEEHEPEYIDLQKILLSIKELKEIDYRDKKLNIRFENVPAINGYPTLISVLFNNLISNAIKYQPSDPDHQINIEITARQLDNGLEILIEDNGIGIDKSYIPDLFTPFKRFHHISEYNGTGLGMPICKRIMAKHHGEIKLKETSEKGTIMSLVFYQNEAIKKEDLAPKEFAA